MKIDMNFDTSELVALLDRLEAVIDRLKHYAENPPENVTIVEGQVHVEISLVSAVRDQ